LQGGRANSPAGAGDSGSFQGYVAAMINASSRYYFWFYGFRSPWQRKGQVWS